ncbi:MAG: class I SAM-dependent methyltransferase [Candidatus Omnitrophica bacterium]|nr:class I SAM-dependent methyltransferase [Candidatus Omnitrophota bacterium]
MNPREYEVMFSVEDRHWWYVGLRHEILRAVNRFASQSPQASASRWLDAGCGTGGLLGHLGVASWWQVGVEITWEGLRLARARRLPNLLQGSVTALPFQDRSFDVVSSIDVLYHQRVDDRRAVAEMARVLKPGGLLVVHVPAFEWLRSEHDAAIWTRRRYTRREVTALLQEAGLRVRASYYRNQLLFPLLALMRALKRRCVEAAHAVSDVAPVPMGLNTVLRGVLRAETALPWWVRSVPFGLSVFCVARRP